MARCAWPKAAPDQSASEAPAVPHTAHSGIESGGASPKANAAGKQARSATTPAAEPKQTKRMSPLSAHSTEPRDAPSTRARHISSSLASTCRGRRARRRRTMTWARRGARRRDRRRGWHAFAPVRARLERPDRHRGSALLASAWARGGPLAGGPRSCPVPGKGTRRVRPAACAGTRLAGLAPTPPTPKHPMS